MKTFKVKSAQRGFCAGTCLAAGHDTWVNVVPKETNGWMGNVCRGVGGECGGPFILYATAVLMWGKKGQRQKQISGVDPSHCFILLWYE